LRDPVGPLAPHRLRVAWLWSVVSPGKVGFPPFSAFARAEASLPGARSRCHVLRWHRQLRWLTGTSPPASPLGHSPALRSKLPSPPQTPAPGPVLGARLRGGRGDRPPTRLSRCGEGDDAGRGGRRKGGFENKTRMERRCSVIYFISKKADQTGRL